MAKFKKIDKSSAKQLYESNGAVFLCASKLRPDSPWGTVSCISLDNCEYASFEKVIDNFKYYNCNEETGLRVNYYIPA